MLKSGLSVALLLTAAAASAQPAPAAPPVTTTTTTARPAQPPQQQVTPPPAFIQAAQAFGQCVEGAATALPATTTPEAGAAQVLVTCAAQKTAIETQFDAWVSSAAFPAEGRDMARQQFRTQFGAVEGQIAAGIRQQRAAAAAPAPAPSN